jgi:hypothetical protein
MPLCAAMLFGFLLLLFFGLRSSAADWLMGDPNLDVVKQDSQLAASGKSLDGSKTDPRTGRKAVNGMSLARRTDKTKRNSRH